MTPTGVGGDAVGPACRRVGKTGLITWRTNKYSVAMADPRIQLGVTEDTDQLRIIELDSGDILADHALCHGTPGISWLVPRVCWLPSPTWISANSKPGSNATA